MRFIRFQVVAIAIAILAFVLCMSSTPAAWSQSTSGDVIGTVLDNSGAAISNAMVTATNVSTGVVTKAQADKQGEFHIPNLLAGTYNITGSSTGFASFTLKNFQVQLNQTATARLVLPVASASTSVEVSSDSYAVIDTSTAQLQTTFQSEDLEVLPTAASGLGVLNLSLLVPGVASPGALGDGTGPSVGGQRSRDNNYTVEGIDNNSKSVTGPLVYVPNDAVGEFTAITNQFSPEFGHSAGGQFNLTVKSGTNHIHGEAYEVMQNRNLNAENAIQGGKVPNPRYDNNRYGGQVGGPVIKNKLFYFVNFERNTVGQSGQYYLCTPTAAGMTALSGVPNLNSTNLGIMTKYTPVSPSQVDASADNACFQQATGGQYMAVFDGDTYNSGTGEYASGTEYDIPLGNYLVEAPNYSNQPALTTSTDWTISPKDSFRGRYIYNKFTGIDTAAAIPAFYEPAPSRYHLIALSEYHDFTPNLINEARVGFNRYYQVTVVGNFKFPGLDQFPNVWLYDQGFLDIGPDGNGPQETIQNLYQFTDNLSWVKGKHSLKFGFDGRKFISPQSFTQRSRGDYEWNYTTEYLHDVAPTAFGERSTGNFNYYGDQTAFYGYVNDIYRITEKFTLNLGLRYEFTSVPEGEKVQALNAAASVPGLITFSKPEPQKGNVLPRFGFNYAFDPNTSVRGGFGMADDVLYDNLGILSFPPQFSSTTDVGSGGPCGTTTCPNPGDPNFLTNGGLPPGTGTLATFPTIADQQAATSAYDPNQTVPYAESWNLGVQHVFAQKYTAEIRYVGTRGIHLPTQVQINVEPRTTAANQLQTYMAVPSETELGTLTNTLYAITSQSYIVPAYRTNGANFLSKITSFQPRSESNYNGLEASLQRQFTNGLALNFAYTYSKTMDDATASVFSTVLTPRRPQNSQNVSADYSRSALDRTHRLTLVAIYNLPFFKNSNWLLKNSLGNWEIAPIYTYESPQYYTVLSGVNSNQNGDSTAIDRTIYNKSGKPGTGSGVTAYANPNLASNCASDSPTDPYGTLLCSKDQVAYVANNPNAMYITAGKGTLPTSERNTQGIQPINNIDASVVKKFSFGESRSLQFSAQAYNVLNHSQFVPGSIDGVNSIGFTSTINFQTAGNSQFNQPGKFFAANARTMQLALKFIF